METVTPRGACNQCQENRERLLMAGKLVIHTKGVKTCHGFQARKKKNKSCQEPRTLVQFFGGVSSLAMCMYVLPGF